MRIVLVRHGHPDVTPDARRPIAGTELGRWYFDAYLVKPGDIQELERLIEGDRADSDALKH
jgi:hypothetical protein